MAREVDDEVCRQIKTVFTQATDQQIKVMFDTYPELDSPEVRKLLALWRGKELP